MIIRLVFPVLVLALMSGCAHQATAHDAPPAASLVESPVVTAEAPPAPADVTAAEDAVAVASQPPETTVRSDDAVPTEVIAAPADAEHGVAVINGAQEEYDPVADGTLPTPVSEPLSFDPLEKYNRKMHRFNNAVDRRIAKPLARTYVKVVPRPMRLGVSNFFSNLGQPVSAVNALLQGKPKQAGQSIGRFLLNSTLGIAGIFDPATSAKIPNKNEDFGQTLGKWGWKRSRYVELPLFGPRTVRDVLGLIGDSRLSPMRRIERDVVRIPLQGLQLVDVRTQLMATDGFREGATDDYALVRDAWLQRRQYQIFGDSDSTTDASLPDYLQNNQDDPTVPVDAMPGLPTTP